MDWDARIIVLQRNLTKDTEVVRISPFSFRIRLCMLFHNSRQNLLLDALLGRAAQPIMFLTTTPLSFRNISPTKNGQDSLLPSNN